MNAGRKSMGFRVPYRLVGILFLLGLFLASQANAFDQTITVRTDDRNGWDLFMPNTAKVRMEPGPGTPPLGIASVVLHSGPGTGTITGCGQGGKTMLGNWSYDGTPWTDLTTLSYSTYVYSTSGHTAANVAPYLNLFIDTDNNGSYDKILVFDPYYNRLGPIPTDTWQTWDVLNGL